LKTDRVQGGGAGWAHGGGAQGGGADRAHGVPPPPPSSAPSQASQVMAKKNFPNARPPVLSLDRSGLKIQQRFTLPGSKIN
jgi:hypothetical protein